MQLPQRFRPLPHRKRINGFTLIEVTIAMIVFLMMVLMFAAVFPLAVRGSIFNNNYAQATTLCQHKLDQLRDEGYSNLMNPGNVLYTSGVVDNPASQSSFPYTYYFTSTDNLTSYYPTGAVGKIVVSRDSNVASGNVEDVAVTISWVTANGANSSYTLYGMIILNTSN